MKRSASGVSAFVIALGALLAALSAFDQAHPPGRGGANIHRDVVRNVNTNVSVGRSLEDHGAPRPLPGHLAPA